MPISRYPHLAECLQQIANLVHADRGPGETGPTFRAHGAGDPEIGSSRQIWMSIVSTTCRPQPSGGRPMSWCRSPTYDVKAAAGRGGQGLP